MPKWSVYILRCADKTLYTGISNDVDKRVDAHNAGKGAKYTRGRLPVVLVWARPMKSSTAARVREAKIKKMTRQEKEELIAL